MVRISTLRNAITDVFSLEGEKDWIQRRVNSDATPFSFVKTNRTATAITLFDEGRNAEVVFSLDENIAYFQTLDGSDAFPFALSLDLE